ncbi:protein-L-isoaspartate O-methyltransferase [Sphaerisporangium krabiense]|uniref:Protein-L-isoaspartate O-methyltransferase n=1 Tax=Sphaerisporangium krabiense TaxID=763782 RepID=A0A7W8Z4L2_9ACTN|nr:methyltransferase domain-containing protein [Sphaerisporangium krabiense]MBB5627334.1 protein-L-isoaspartate(D-aspartate) O-methyltransferase [Sphaerisporangium krabiense]GII64530.1 protein-L-isoaspartate O-methyltransferase [Sphaerisporangium krabiense]
MSIDQRITGLSGRLSGLDDRWRAAFHAVPRHLFIPERAWYHSPDGPDHLIDRSVDPDAWMDAVYSDAPIVTQLDDGATDIAEGKGAFTSSSSMPSAVAATLRPLDPYDGDEVLEIGTGTGWTAGLLAHRLGDEHVTSIEIDPAVHAVAAENLRRSGHSPRLVLGDGAVGYADGAPYDRVHVTCGVSEVPYPWIEQARPGGAIVLPWTPRRQGGYLTVLTVVGDGTAVGRFHGGVGFMPLRSQRWARPQLEGDHRRSSTSLDPRRVVRSSTGADIAVAGLLPDVYVTHADQEDGGFHLSLWSDRSDAQVHYAPDHKRVAVLQRGPRDLWDEVEAAYLRWVSWGTPSKERFGMTVTPQGQHIWLDSPQNPLG